MIDLQLTPEILQLRAAAVDFETISGPDGAPYLERYVLQKEKSSSLYLHHFVGSDWSRDLHDHPAAFTSIGLIGGYVEHTPNGADYFVAPWVRHFPAEHVHRLVLLRTDCWTLVHVGDRSRDWGFWRNGEWIQWQRYFRESGYPESALQ
jgi:hypothetical protein